MTYSPASLVCTRGLACSLAAPVVAGGAPSAFSITPALPAGLAFDAGTGAIAGTPTTLAAAATYLVRATNEGGSATTGLSVRVNDVAPSGLAYGVSTVSCFTRSPCPVAAPTVAGGPVVTYASTPPLPTGLSFMSDGSIAGTPTAVRAEATYTITATNSGGSTSAQLTLGVASHAVTPNALNVSSMEFLSVTVTGQGLTQYRYKVGPEPCQQASGYSYPRPLATPITDSVVGIVDTTAFLCVQGGNARDHWQPLASKTDLVDATVPYELDLSPRTLLRAFDVVPDDWAVSRDVVVRLPTGTTSSSATCTGCQLMAASGGAWSASLPVVTDSMIIRVRHRAAATLAAETSSIVTWDPGGTWTFRSRTHTSTCGPGARRVFLTHQKYPGDLGGLAGADAKCQAEAGVAGLGGTWQALLGTLGGLDPSDRLSPTAVYCSLQGRQVIVGRGFVAPLVFDVSGAAMVPTQSFAGTFPIKPRENQKWWYGGTDLDCSGWTSNQSGPTPVVPATWGRVSSFTPADPTWGWLSLVNGGSGATGCATPQRLLCFEQ